MYGANGIVDGSTLSRDPTDHPPLLLVFSLLEKSFTVRSSVQRVAHVTAMICFNFEEERHKKDEGRK